MRASICITLDFALLCLYDSGAGEGR
jgi:hypothetical protein